MNLPTRKKLGSDNRLGISDVFENSPALSADTGPIIRTGLIAIVIGFGGFITWAAWAPLDEGVPVQAQVTIETKRKTVQHMTGGVVQRVLVREGQQVKAGDLLVELDASASRANFESVRQNYMGQRAMESRLQAEIESQSAISFHADLLAASKDMQVAQHMQTQRQLFEARRRAFQNEIKALHENIAAMKAQIAGIDQQIDSRKQQAEKLSEQLSSLSDLAREGYVPRNQVLQLEQSHAELRSILADLQGNRQKLDRSIAEMQMHEAQRRQEVLKDAGSQLADVRREVQSGRERLEATSADLARVKITAPVDGQVVSLALASVGGVVAPSQKLMDIVPIAEAVMLDAKIPPHMIDRVKSGDEAAVRFSSFAHSPQLVVEGVIHSISTDAVVENTPMGTASFYLARVQITPDGLKTLGSRNLHPGMQAEVLIRTGERSLLTYLMHPLTKRIAASMKEE